MSNEETPTHELFSRAEGADVRVRFCPSPTGTPHVGLIRTALFNWAYARHTGGKLVFRIEDTDEARDSEESYAQIVEALTWLGLDWDEGIGVGGPHEPYRQSQRGEIYQGIIEKLRAAGHLYESFATADEIKARNEANGRDERQGYDNFERDLTDDERARLRAEGREPSLRLRVPDEDLSFVDLVRGEVTFKAGTFSDFVVVRPNGKPLYTFVNPVDDAIMGITHVLRGEDLLSSTPRQIALYRALIEIGVAKAIPQFGHLPYVMGEGSKKLSKRDPEANLFNHRDAGMIPEGLLNYLALLGWSLAPDRDVFSRDEMVEAFDVHDVLGNPARFDEKKAVAINGDHVRMLDVADFTARLVPYLRDAGVPGFAEQGDAPSASAGDEDASGSRVEDGLPDARGLAALDPEVRRRLEAVAPLVQERMQLLGDAPALVRFLFVSADELRFSEDALKTLKDDSVTVLEESARVLGDLDASTFDHETIEAVLRRTLIDELGMKPRTAFGPLRVAISGERVSPPLFESMQILGRDETLARIAKLVGETAPAAA